MTPWIRAQLWPQRPLPLPGALCRDVLTHQQETSRTANHPWACEPSVPSVLACSWPLPAHGTSSFSFLSHRNLEPMRPTGSVLPKDRDECKRALRVMLVGKHGGGDLVRKGKPQIGQRAEFNFPEHLLCARYLYTQPCLSLIILESRLCSIITSSIL